MDNFEIMVQGMKEIRGIVSLDDDVYDLYSKDDLINMLKNTRDEADSVLQKVGRAGLFNHD